MSGKLGDALLRGVGSMDASASIITFVSEPEPDSKLGNVWLSVYYIHFIFNLINSLHFQYLTLRLNRNNCLRAQAAPSIIIDRAAG